ncbi:MAG: type II toxin-antitoxin system RelE/ParE family toxin [Hyphomicrobium sp.]
MKVSYAPRARDDLSEIHGWLSERSTQAATTVISAIRDTARLIGEYPGIGRSTDIDDVKVLPVVRYPYLVYHTVQPNEVVIVHVRHGSRAGPELGEF